MNASRRLRLIEENFFLAALDSGRVVECERLKRVVGLLIVDAILEPRKIARVHNQRGDRGDGYSQL